MEFGFDQSGGQFENAADELAAVTFHRRPLFAGWDVDCFAYISQDSSSADRYIRVMNIDGTGDRVLETRTLGTQMHRVVSLAWSPNGVEIVYSSSDGYLWIMNADGTNKRRLTQ